MDNVDQCLILTTQNYVKPKPSSSIKAFYMHQRISMTYSLRTNIILALIVLVKYNKNPHDTYCALYKTTESIYSERVTTIPELFTISAGIFIFQAI